MHHTWVQFQIKDVLFPKPSEILLQLHERDSLQGRLVDLSDRGAEKDAFAMIRVHGLQQVVVVPARHVHRFVPSDTQEAVDSGDSEGGVDVPQDQPEIDIETMPGPDTFYPPSEATGETREREEP